MKRVGTLLIIAIVGVLLLAGGVFTTSRAQVEGCRFFIDTGHYVCNEFLEFYTERGGLEIFGYPLTEAYDDPQLGLQVQYFQRARMEWHPDNQAPYRVQLGLLIDELGYSYPLASPEEIPIVPVPNRRYFPQTGHVVSYAFLEYFREKGGVDIFGYPRSEMLYEGGYLVQYFQRARMEWHPESKRVRLANIGETYTSLLDINTAPVIIELRQLNATVTVRHIIVGEQSAQTVFVYVVDQYRNPVEGVDVEGVVRYQGSEPVEQSCAFPRTDARGFTQCSFDFAAARSGQKVLVDVTARRDGLTDAVQTFFFLWW